MKPSKDRVRLLGKSIISLRLLGLLSENRIRSSPAQQKVVLSGSVLGREGHLGALGGTHAGLHEREGPLREPNQPHAVVDPARPQPALGNLKATAGAQNYVLLGDTHVLESYFTVAT